MNRLANFISLRSVVLAAGFVGVWAGIGGRGTAEDLAQVARQVRSIISNRCFACHGPDEAERKAGLRLDNRESVLAAAESGERPVVPGEPERSELLRRLRSTDDGERMPPSDFGPRLSEKEIASFEQWIKLGAPFEQHWSFVPPRRPKLPEIQAAGDIETRWLHHPVDRFVLAMQKQRQLTPSIEADRAALLRRVSLDLIGLPPSVDQVKRFAADENPDAYERAVDELLASPAYGEHWARKWLDLARYADSAGYADDPLRTIWAYRDWVINALNDNMTFDQFTVEQIAGDLLPNPSQSQLIATAFHRNTLTNNEGGTNDEEFRNVAVVDRVNTTMAVWMGVTFNCAQCHTHKYDPFTQEEYFKVFAVFNQSRDADRADESPIVEIFTREQEEQKRAWLDRIGQLETDLRTVSPAVLNELAKWETTIAAPNWIALEPLKFAAKTNTEATWSSDQVIRVKPLGNNIVKDSYIIDLAIPAGLKNKSVYAIGLRSVPSDDLPGRGAGLANGNFVITNVRATLVDAADKARKARFVRVELPGKEKILSLAEVEVFSGGKNISSTGTASQSSTAFSGPAKLAIDGNTDGDHEKGSVTHTQSSMDPWWELDLGQEQSIEKLVIWNRTGADLFRRLDGAQIALLDKERQTIFSQALTDAPRKEKTLDVQVTQPITVVDAFADYHQPGFPPSNLVVQGNVDGWAVGGSVEQPHLLTLAIKLPIEMTGDRVLRIEIDHNSTHRHHLLGNFQVVVSDHTRAVDWASMDVALQAIALKPASQRTGEEQQALAKFFARSLAPSLADSRLELKELRNKLSVMKPATSVPIMREAARDSRRETYVQLRGNYKSLGPKVEAGVPQVFLLPTPQSKAPDRLDLARWLVDCNNPLTARVLVNRLWESLFGLGLVRTSEEFGSQGELPSHPELLDWLACELMDTGWDCKRMLRLLVMSQTYRQTSQVSESKLHQDAVNVWLSRGPRVRLSAEMVRDQALAASGLLSHKFHGPPVKPPQPEMGLKAAFGSDTDWQASQGEDRYRRGLYTAWRRSNPYPSMATFDAPSREVCILRRDSTNTPLQALVTLNDPAFVEAAQALARRIVIEFSQLKSDPERLTLMFELCASRAPEKSELQTLQGLLDDCRGRLKTQAEASKSLATVPLGPAPAESDTTELAAWTVVANVLLNLDEVLMKR